ncbi:MAG: hypothetical protein J5367_08390, partial [Lachnospiraceae bacterium]|nr:hypothetical protein [Lachnospiraceae bacterium]
MCAAVLAGCGKSADSSSIPDEPKGNAVAESEPKQAEEQPESAEKIDDSVEKRSLAQRMSGKYSYHASGEEGEDEYYIMNVVNFGDNLYAFCGQAFSDGEENPEAYSFWATEFIPNDAKEMSSTDGNMVKVTELNFSVMSNAGKYWDSGHTGTISLADDGLLFEGFDQDGFLVADDGNSRFFHKDERVEDAFSYLKHEPDGGDKDLQGFWVMRDSGADLYIEFSGSDMYMYRKYPDREVFLAAGGCEYHDGSFDCRGNRIENGGMPFEFTADYKVEGGSLNIKIKDDAPDQMPAEATLERISEQDIHVTTTDEIALNEVVYEPVFTEILDVINYGYNIDREYDYVSGSLSEHINYGGMKDPLDEVGYRLEDISGDGIPELLIGYDADYLHNGGESYITGIYTIKDGKPVVTYAGGTKGSCRRLDEKRFASSVSGGVSLTVTGAFHLSDDGCDIIWDDCYFTDEKEDGSVGYFHNKTGVIDASRSEEMENGDEVFNEIM